MATSGSVDYAVTRDDIVNQALELLNIIAAGETPSAADSKLAQNRLNGLIKHLQTRGANLWAIEEAYLFLADETGEYSLGSATTDARATKKDDAVLTELSADIDTSDTILSIDDSTGMAASDIVGIVMDDDTVHWSTIASVDSTSQITINDAVTTAAAEDNNIYTFTSRINRPLKVLSARYVTGNEADTTLNEIPLKQLSKQEYFNLPAKNTNSTPNSFYYDPQLISGNFYLWPRPDDPEGYIRFTYARTLEDFDASADNPDFPQEWYEVLVYQLASRLGPIYGRAEDDNYKVISTQAELMLIDALLWDQEDAAVQIRIINN